MPDLSGQSVPRRAPRLTVSASGLLCGALALVVIYTSKREFFSPMAVLIVAAIGLAAVLLQSRFRAQPASRSLRAPMTLNMLGIVFALVALFADWLHLRASIEEILALASV